MRKKKEAPLRRAARWIMNALFIVGAIGFLWGVVMCFAGCDFARGYRDETVKQGIQLGADYGADKLGKDFSELKDALRDLPKNLPQHDPAGGSALYSLGTLAALLAANAARGAIRKYQEKRKGGS